MQPLHLPFVFLTLWFLAQPVHLPFVFLTLCFLVQALSPSVAECLRAVFAAFMWHEGIVHDAMACASFLKFHPDLTKAMSQFVKGKKQERVRQRHATDSSKDKRDSRERRSLGQGNLNETRVRFNLEPQVGFLAVELKSMWLLLCVFLIQVPRLWVDILKKYSEANFNFAHFLSSFNNNNKIPVGRRLTNFRVKSWICRSSSDNMLNQIDRIRVGPLPPSPPW